MSLRPQVDGFMCKYKVNVTVKVTGSVSPDGRSIQVKGECGCNYRWLVVAGDTSSRMRMSSCAICWTACTRSCCSCCRTRPPTRSSSRSVAPPPSSPPSSGGCCRTRSTVSSAAWSPKSTTLSWVSGQGTWLGEWAGYMAG